MAGSNRKTVHFGFSIKLPQILIERMKEFCSADNCRCYMNSIGRGEAFLFFT